MHGKSEGKWMSCWQNNDCVVVWNHKGRHSRTWVRGRVVMLKEWLAETWLWARTVLSKNLKTFKQLDTAAFFGDLCHRKRYFMMLYPMILLIHIPPSDLYAEMISSIHLIAVSVHSVSNFRFVVPFTFEFHRGYVRNRFEFQSRS